MGTEEDTEHVSRSLARFHTKNVKSALPVLKILRASRSMPQQYSFESTETSNNDDDDDDDDDGFVFSPSFCPTSPCIFPPCSIGSGSVLAFAVYSHAFLCH
jgi:hypothetical protein